MVLRDHIFGKIKENRKLKSVLVDAWGLTVYFTPISVAERRKIRDGAMAPAPGKPGEMQISIDEFQVLTVLHKALDAEGNMIFKPSDADVLRDEAEAPVIAQISEEVHGAYLQSAKNGSSGKRDS